MEEGVDVGWTGTTTCEGWREQESKWEVEGRRYSQSHKKREVFVKKSEIKAMKSFDCVQHKIGPCN